MLADEFQILPGEGAVETVQLGVACCKSDLRAAGPPAWPQIEEDNLRLRQLLRDVVALLAEGPFFNGRTLYAVELLKGLSRQLAVHFALEETLDPYAGPDTVVVELAGLAEALRSEHRALKTEIDGVVDEAESLFASAAEPGTDRKRIHTRIRVFCHRLREHERRENELLLKAYEDDVGVGD